MGHNLQTVQNLLSQHMEELGRTYKVRRIGVFGSMARGEESGKSDVDILVEFTEPIGLFHFLELETFLRSLLRRDVDLVTVRALKPAIRERVLKETVYVTS